MKPKVEKNKAVNDSFHPMEIELESRGRTRSKAAYRTLDNEQDKGEEPTQSWPSSDSGRLSPKRKGQKIHKELSEQINKNTRHGKAGEILKMMEHNFSCEFIKAEVYISGFAIMKTRRKSQRDFWSGKMDAVAIRRSENDVLEVFVVDWKTTAKTTDLADIPNWWKNATNFKRPLYQCLVYRELLLAHLKRYNVEALVGIILVPLHQLTLQLQPRLCVDFQRMVEVHLLDKLQKFQWFAVLDDSIYAQTIKLQCKLFKEGVDPADVVDESNNNLKGNTRLKDILNENATVADLLRALDLPFLKVEGIKEKEKKAQKDGKTSGIEIAAPSEDKTNEELGEVYPGDQRFFLRKWRQKAADTARAAKATPETPTPTPTPETAQDKPLAPSVGEVKQKGKNPRLKIKPRLSRIMKKT